MSKSMSRSELWKSLLEELSKEVQTWSREDLICYCLDNLADKYANYSDYRLLLEYDSLKTQGVLLKDVSQKTGTFFLPGKI